jgi:hypothetical protein
MGVADISSSPKARLELAELPRMEWAPIADIRPNPKNARTHSKKQIRQIAASIRKLGFLNPLIVDDENMILAGHGRLEGARLEGMAHVPIVRFGPAMRQSPGAAVSSTSAVRVFSADDEPARFEAISLLVSA